MFFTSADEKVFMIDRQDKDSNDEFELLTLILRDKTHYQLGN